MTEAVARQDLAARTDMAHMVGESGSIMEVISRAASDPNTDVAKLERLMDLYERITAMQAKRAYQSALSEMQTELPEIEERGKGHGNIRYALWEDINEAIKPVMSQHGFALSFRTGNESGQIVVTGVLSHRDGHSEQTTMHLPADQSGSKNAVQAVGSSTSYGKRYVAQALLNLTSRGEDDDGRRAGVGPTITDAQLDDLRALISEVGAKEPLFVKYLKVPSLGQLPAGRFSEAIAALEAKRSKS